MKKFYLWMLCCLTFSAVQATHIVGGEFELTALNGRGNAYTLALNLYFDDIYGNPQAEDPQIVAAVFRKSNNTLVASFVLSRVSSAQVNYTNPVCTSARLRTRQIRYATEIFLLPSAYNDPAGYYVVWERCCRNNAINNIDSPGDAGMTFYLEFPAVTQNNAPFINNSPRFVIPAGDYACVNEPFTFEFGATDPDGDQLTYKLVTPYQGYSSAAVPAPSASSGPYPSVTWSNGISLTNVIPGKKPLAVNAATGQLTFTANRTGLYVFSVLAEEFRAGKKIGEIRRDFQLMVIDCPKSVKPRVYMKNPVAAGFYRAGTVINVPIDASRCFDLAIADSTLRDNINLQLRPLNFSGDLVTFTPTSGVLNGPTDTLRTKLCWNECAGNPPGQPYEFEIIASDNSCPLPKRDTLLVRMNLEQKPNNTPVVSTSLNNNTAIVQAGETLTFNVTGSDMPDNDQITLEAIGKGFDLAAAGMQFTGGSATGSLTSPFSWQPDCANVREGQFYLVDFIVRDQRCPEQPQADTITVNLQFKSRPTQTPTIITTLPDNRSELVINQEIRFDVIAEDPDGDLITLRAVGRGFDLAAVGIQFKNNQSGLGRIEEPFVWQASCENMLEDRGMYVIDFITEDNSCAPNRADTVTVELNLTNFEVSFDGFAPPNVFTPNYDGANDAFFIPNLPADNCKNQFESIEIYNRWGKQVYIGETREFSWNGFGFPTGTYYYLIHYRNNTYKGWVSLLR